MGPVAWFGRFKTAPGWALLIAAVNLVGIGYGFYYYLDQFAVTPVWLWIFVPDSPLAVLWAELALLAWWAGRRVGALDALAFVGNVQVGLWTVYVLLAYADSFGTYRLNLNTILLAGHAGMAVLALIYLDGLRGLRRRSPRAWGVALAVAGGYYAVNDALDYFGPGSRLHPGCGMRPYTVPCEPGPEAALAAVTIALTAASVAALWLLTRRRDEAPGQRPAGDR